MKIALHPITFSNPIRFITLFSLALLLVPPPLSAQKLEIQGHRGCRGLLPENSIPAMIRAIDLGVHTLEMDVVISRDGQVLLSHEPWLNPTICTDTLGKRIPATASHKDYNLYKMDYSAIKKCDCGSQGNPRFPEQAKIPTYKPLLSEVIDTVTHYLKSKDLPPIHYNIEIKSTKAHEGEFHPEPGAFTEMVLDIIRKKGIQDLVIIQCFDPRPLEWTRRFHPEITLAYLVAEESNIQTALKQLTFTPDIYSPWHVLLSKKSVNYAHEKGIRVIPWTVNTDKEIKKTLKKGVDGIITDYPGRVGD